MADSGAGAGPVAGMPAGGAFTSGVTRGRGPLARMLLRVAGPVVSAQTWLAVIHLMAGVVTGTLAFGVIVVLALVGIGTLWLFLIGLPVLVAALWVSLQFGRAERARFLVMLGVRVPAAPLPVSPDRGRWRRMWRLLTARVAWRHTGYALIRLPLSLVEMMIVTAVWSFALAMLGLPLFGWLLIELQWHVNAGLPHPLTVALAVLLGLIVLPVAPRVTLALATADAAVARYLIGPGSQTDMTVRIGELERSRARAVGSAEAERRRIERDLHDGAQQRLVSLAMNLGRARERFATDPEGARAIIDQAHDEAKQALTELRNLVRGVHPPVLSDRGLDAAISGLAALSPVPVTVHASLPARPSSSIEAIAYFIVAEALTNVAKHARSTQAEVTVSRHGDVLRVLIRDDGIGGADPQGQGLAGLADRLAGVDGRLSVRSPAGGPTVIEAELPCGS
ncbi:MAG: sensor histidine kinase [Streptosporangiaceae bacterium]